MRLNIDRPARQNGSVLQGEGKDEVARPGRQANGRVEIQSFARRVDNRRAGYAERRDVAGQRFALHGSSEFPLQSSWPVRASSACTTLLSVTAISMAGAESRPAANTAAAHRVAPDGLGMEGRIEMQRPGPIPAQIGNDGMSASIRTAVIRAPRTAGQRQQRRPRSPPRRPGKPREFASFTHRGETLPLL